MSPTTGLREPTSNRSSVAAFVARTLAALAVAFFVPWVTYYVEPKRQ
jgi:hypothetical protein